MKPSLNGFSAALILAAWLPGAAFAQFTQKLPEFEVASIRPYITDSAKVGPGTVDAQMPNLSVNESRIVNIVNLNLRNLIMLAYGVGGAQVVAPAWQGDPEWINNRFSIMAKVPGDGSKKDVPLMLQALLAERFHLAVHREEKTTAVYALEIGKGPLKLQEVKADEDVSPSGCIRSYGSQPGWFNATCKGMTSARAAQAIQGLGPAFFAGRPVVDMTGLTGVYDFSVEWAMKAVIDNGGDGQSMFEAVEKLGLKFVPTNHAIDLIVVDHCDKQPTAN
jgi:uncharacterized protein (TIGR03435 family)